jgi:GntR family transcriptional regulator/MocR family aminotransferase
MLVRLEGRAGPLHRRVYDAMREAVLQGRLRSGQRLPSTRALAKELGVSRTVTLQAYDRLFAEGVLVARQGSGSYVADTLPGEGWLSWAGQRGAAGSVATDRGVGRRSHRGESTEPAVPALRISKRVSALLPFAADGVGHERELALDFRYGRPDPGVLALRTWRRLVSKVAARPPVGYVGAGGSHRLRRALASYLGRSRGVRCDADRILVVTGSQQALDLTARVLLEPGDRVLLEEPHYQGAREAFRAAGAALCTAPTDSEGLITATLPRGDASPRLACVTPSHQFPLGGVLTLSRRLELLAWARDVNAVVLEDDYDGEFRYDAAPVEAIQGLDRDGRVVYAGTFSKVLFPALRLGYLVLPDALVEPFRAAKWTCDRHSALLEQEALAEFIDEGHFERHLRRARKRYAARREVLLDALHAKLGDTISVEGQAAGVHVVVWLHGRAATVLDPLIEEAARRGVGVYPVRPYYLGEPPGAGLMLGYAALAEDAIRQGVARLAEALTVAERAAPRATSP